MSNELIEVKYVDIGIGSVEQDLAGPFETSET